MNNPAAQAAIHRYITAGYMPAALILGVTLAGLGIAAGVVALRLRRAR